MYWEEKKIENAQKIVLSVLREATKSTQKR